MQTNTRLDVVAKVGEYVNSNGETKKRYLRVGTAFLYLKDGNFDGVSIVLDAVPFTNELRLLLPKESNGTN